MAQELRLAHRRRVTLRRRICRLTIVVALVLACCWYLRITGVRDVKAYVGMSLQCHPVWKDLAIGTVYEGQDVDEVIADTQPVYIIRHGRYVELNYQLPLSFTVVYIRARDGSLVQAGAASCTWEHTFFDSMSESDIQEMRNSSDVNERSLTYNGPMVEQ